MRIGPYTVENELGRGGAGVVLAARDPSGAPVAIKLLHAAAARPDALARFDRERRILAGLGESQGFVPLRDSGTCEAGAYLVMALVPGGTLRDRLDRGPLAPREAVDVVGRVARALGRAHAFGIVHRDLKPENILFTAAGLPLVADLGLAKHFESSAPGASQSAALSRSGAFRGTVGYMAPEQADDAKSVGPAADAFSLGCVLYEALVGRHPFEAATPVEVIGRVADGRFEPLAAACPAAPRGLDRFLLRALARDPRRRPGNGDAFARELALAVEGGAPPGGGARRVLAAVAALVGALGIGALVLRAPSPPPPAAGPGPVASLAPSPVSSAHASASPVAAVFTRTLAARQRLVAAARRGELSGASQWPPDERAEAVAAGVAWLAQGCRSLEPPVDRVTTAADWARLDRLAAAWTALRSLDPAPPAPAELREFVVGIQILCRNSEPGTLVDGKTAVAELAAGVLEGAELDDVIEVSVRCFEPSFGLALSRARPLAARVLAAHPGSARARLASASVLLRGDPSAPRSAAAGEAALASAIEACRREPGYVPPVAHGLGLIHGAGALSAEEYGRALDTLVVLDGESWIVRLGLAKSARDRGDADRASDEYRAALAHVPPSSEAGLRLGFETFLADCARQLGAPDVPATAARLEADPGWAGVVLALASAGDLLGRGDSEQAAVVLDHRATRAPAADRAELEALAVEAHAATSQDARGLVAQRLAAAVRARLGP